MNKVGKLVGSLLIILVLTGCGISQKNLMENDWELTSNTEMGNMDYKLNFSEEELTLSLKDMSHESNQTQGSILGDLVTELAQSMEISYNYQVNSNKLSIQNPDLEVDLVYEMEKEDSNNIRLIEIVEDENTERSGFDNALLKPIDNESESESETESATIGSTEEVSSETETRELDVKTNLYSVIGLEYSVPEDWIEEVSDERLKYYYPEDGMLMVSSAEISETVTDDISRAELLEGITSNLESYELVSESELTIDSKKAYRYEMKNVISNQKYKTSLIIFDYGYGVVTLFMTVLEDSDKDYSSEFDGILSSIVISDDAILE